MRTHNGLSLGFQRRRWTLQRVQAVLPVLLLCGSFSRRLSLVTPAMAASYSSSSSSSPSPNGEGKVVTLFDVYYARQAAFGDAIPEYGYFNLMLPPSGSNETLCEYPQVVWNATHSRPGTQELPQNAASRNADMALLVRWGNCTAETQARNAAKLRKTVVPQLRYLIIQGPEEMDNSLPWLLPDDTTNHSSSSTDPILRSIGVLSTTFQYGEYMRQAMLNVEAASLDSPILFDPNNVNWVWIGSIDPYFFKNNGSNNSNNGPTDNFYWFRVLLFTLLIVSPCLRAAYLWWAGGGRIRFRRNADGNITGLQYVPPVPYWLSSGMIPGARPVSEGITNTLTEEEFRALPEIEYKLVEPSEREDYDEEEAVEAGTGLSPSRRESAPQQQQQRHSLSSVAATEHPRTDDSSEGVVGRDPLEQPMTLSSTCTMCSICIDDFEDGETLVLLPRCRHSFHRDCIHPWVTERQGCCPLCKTHVLEKGDASTGSSSSSIDDSPSPTISADTDNDNNANDDRPILIWNGSDAATEPDTRDEPDTATAAVGGEPSGAAASAAGETPLTTSLSTNEEPERWRRPTPLPM